MIYFVAFQEKIIPILTEMCGVISRLLDNRYNIAKSCLAAFIAHIIFLPLALLLAFNIISPPISYL